VHLSLSPCCTIQYGRTALHYAAIIGHMKIVKCLVEEGQAVITTQDKYGNTPIIFAEHNGHTNVANYLKAQLMMKVVIQSNVLPFYSGVLSIIAKYLQ